MRRAYEAAMRAQAAVESLVGSAVPHSSRKDPFAGLVPWELTTAASLHVPAADSTYGAELFEFAGVCHLSDAAPPNLLADCLTAANAHTTAVRKAVTDCGFDPDGPLGFRFTEACQRGPGRVDLRLLPAPPPPFDDARISGEDAAWMPLVRRILGDDCKLLFIGLVSTEPGITTEQALHCDGPHVAPLWREHEPTRAADGDQHPCHCLTVFVPLVDLTRENGATSFLPGTHHSAIATAALASEASEAGTSGGAGVSARLELAAGSAVLFDYRLFHAGGANNSDERRPILYLNYARPWFEDEHNFGYLPLGVDLGGTMKQDAKRDRDGTTRKAGRKLLSNRSVYSHMPFVPCDL